MSVLLRATVASAAALIVLGGCAATTTATARPSASRDPAPVAGPTLEGEVIVYAAASLTESFETIAAAFSATHPEVSVTFNFGGSPALAAGIVSGAPVDVFASASASTMETVTDAALPDHEPLVFARNILEIAVPPGNPGDVTRLSDFADETRTLALCAPEVPCGAAAASVFVVAGVTPAPDTYEQDVKAALTKVQLGEVDAALVYRTDILASEGAVDGIGFEEAGDAINDYPIATLTAAPNPDAAEAFVDFVVSEDGQELLANAGFQTD